MGLMIHSLAELPEDVDRRCYLYLLDYGWSEPVVEALHRNWDRMSAAASRTGAVILRGVVGAHFEDQVLSWHHINGEEADDLLPAILLTNRNPHEFRNRPADDESEADYPFVLVPLRRFCSNAQDVVELVEGIFDDITHGLEILEFQIAKEMRRREEGAFADALILEPNVAGVGIDIKALLGWLRTKVAGEG